MDIVVEFCVEKQLVLEDISKLSPVDFMTKTMSIIDNEKIILVLSTKKANNVLLEILKSINMIGALEEQVIVYHKDNYFIDDLNDFNRENLVRWYNKSIRENDNVLCQLCSKKYFNEVNKEKIDLCSEIQSINCPCCFYKYCSNCLSVNVLKRDLCCINCNEKWKGSLTIKSF